MVGRDTVVFPDMKALVDKVHGFGLKAGWYATRPLEPPRCHRHGLFATRLVSKGALYPLWNRRFCSLSVPQLWCKLVFVLVKEDMTYRHAWCSVW